FYLTGIPGVQGPPGATRFGGGTFQSVAGVSASWDVLELVRQPKVVGAAKATVTATRAQSEATRLTIAAETADAYLLVVEARALASAAQASEERTQTFHDVVATLVGQQLRPDLDLARAETDLVGARILVDKTRVGVVVTSAKLAESVGEN